MAIREKTKERYDSFMEELKRYCDKKQHFALSELIKVHSVTANAGTLLTKLGYLKSSGDRKPIYQLVLPSTMDIYDVAIKLVEESNKYQKERTLIAKQQNEVSKVTENKIPLSPLVDTIIEITSIGNKFNIRPDRMNEFVKEILSFKSKV